jgi:hypothetical protein
MACALLPQPTNLGGSSATGIGMVDSKIRTNTFVTDVGEHWYLAKFRSPDAHAAIRANVDGPAQFSCHEHSIAWAEHGVNNDPNLAGSTACPIQRPNVASVVGGALAQ